MPQSLRYLDRVPPSWRKIFSRPAPAQMAAKPAAKFSLDVSADLLSALTGGGAIAPAISRNEAMQVPAVMRARNLIAGSIAKLPLTVQGPDFVEVTDTQYLVNTPPDPEVPQVVTMALTVEDLLFYSVAWWQVTKWGWHGYPVEARYVPHSSVLVAQTRGLPPSRLVISPDELFPTPGEGGQVYIDGRPVPDNEIIRFDSPNPPLLRHAARAIRTCLLLDQTVALYAQDPIPLGVFTPLDGDNPPPDDDVQTALDNWAQATRSRAWPYLGAALKPNPLQWNPEQLQLAAQRQHAVLEIARATGVDADYLEAASEVASETYANSEDKRQDLIDFTCDPYLTAIQQRLSMRDCLPRGYNARFDVTGFVRGDTKARMDTYKVGLEVGAYTKPEIRKLEHKRPLTPAELADSAPISPTKPVPAQQVPVDVPAAGAQPTKAPAAAQQGRSPMGTANFDAGDQAVRVQFQAPSTEDFRVDAQKRTITGLTLPWNTVADNGVARWRFAEGSLSWSDPSRVKLNLDHTNDLIGVATRLQSGRAGLTGTFKVGRGTEGDRALTQAEDGILDGFSVEVVFDSADAWQPDPTDESVRLVNHAVLRGVALTGTPAFDDARLTSVNASRNNGKEGTMPETGTMGQAPAAVDFDAHLTALADKMAESHKKLTEGLAQSLGDSISEGVKAALDNISTPQDGPQPVRAARYTISREAPVYPLDGSGHSLVRDAWYSIRERDDDATERLRRFRQQTHELAKVARHAIAFGGGRREAFTTGTTSTASQIIPPGYRPELFVPMLNQQRPMVNALSQGTIENATPFVVPVFGSFSGATVDNVEGVNPTDGTLTFTSKTVTPGAISGRLVLSREIVDSSNPAIDQIALASMRESYARQTEAKVFTLLNGASGAGGTITSGFVPSGAQASQSASGAATALPVDIRKALALYPFRRFQAPSIGLMSSIATTALAAVTDTTNRPLFPSVGAMNSSGVANAVDQGWYVDGLAFVPAWAMTGVVGANDTHVFILNQADGWVWESPTLLFRFEEKQGPALIELALFGYFATHLLRPVGLAGIRMTAP